MLTVRLLGPVEVLADDRPLELGGPQQRAVIAHLALEAGHVVSVDRLVDRLWGDELPRSPLGTLQSYVSRLRRALEPDRGPGAPPAVLVSEAPGYALRIPAEQIDIQRFRTLVERARHAPPAAALAALDEGLALWRGPALAGLGAEGAAALAAVRLEEERQAAIEQRFDALLALGRATDAVPALQEAVDDEPLRERRWALLALALYRTGRQAEALRALSQARSTLLDELGLDPGPELRDLEQRILAQDAGLLLVAPAAPAAVTPTVSAAEPAEIHPSLVGRDAEWGTLATALVRAATGPAQLVLVEGDPGIGKSTLLGALVDHAGAAGWRCAVGRCVEPGLAPSLWPWIEVARTLVDPASAVAPGNPWRALAAEARDATSLPSPVELAGSFVDALDELDGGRGRPLLLVLDDLHWADTPTVDVLRFVVERLGPRRALVVAAHRPVELVPGSVLASSLAHLHLAAGAPTRVMMAPLADEAVAELIGMTTGAAPSPELADRVRRRAGGNPLFVCELARLAGERGLADDAEVPTAIRDVVRRRLAPLPERATAELEVAATLGERFDLRTVMAASERDPDSCLDALDAAIVIRILVPDGDGFRFVHALVRDAVLADVPPLRLARLHHRAAEAILAVRGDGADAAEPIAHHRLASLALADPLVVAKSVVHAADIARWSGALDAADHLAERALELLAGLARTEAVDALEAEALESIVAAAHRRRQPGAIERATQQVVDFADAAGSDAARALALFVQFHNLDQSPSDPAVQALVGRMRELAATTASPYASVMSNFVLGAFALSLGQLDVADEHIRIAYRAAGAPRADQRPVHVPLGNVPYVGSVVAALRGDADDAREQADRRVRAWSDRRADVDPAFRNVLAFYHALIETLLGEPQRVLDELGREPGGVVDGLMEEQPSICDLMIGWARAELGDTGAMDATWAAMDVLATSHTQESLPVLRAIHGAACLAAGDPRALDVLTQAREEAVASEEVWWLAETLRLLAEATAAAGDQPRAAALAAEAEELAAAQGARLLLPRVAATRQRLANLTATTAGSASPDPPPPPGTDTR